MPAYRSLRARRFAGCFARAERGATAVEFALIALPFFILMFGLMELTVVLLASTTLETATEIAARQIRTGEFQVSAANTKAGFKTLVCNKMSWLQPKCAADLFVDVQTFSNFAALAVNAPVSGINFDPAATCFSPGEPTDIVLVRTYFRWRLFTPLLNNALETMGSGSGMRLISSATAFRNEPYSENLPVGAKC